LVARHFELDVHPTAAFGTYDVAAFYVFGAALALGANLLGLQLLNSAFGAGAAVATYFASRQIFPAHAWLLGLIVACHPSLVLLSSAGLLKDPAIMFAAAVFVAAALRGLREEKWPRAVVPWAVAGLALVFLRTSRFYVAAYLEIGLLAVAALAALAGPFRERRHIILGALAAVAIGEIVPWVLGWPFSVLLLISQISHVLGHPLMLYGAGGFTESLLGVDVAAGERSEGVFRAVDALRRIFGPFVWMIPNRWDRATLFYRGDYLLYPGTIVWYATIPYLAFGLWTAAGDIRRKALTRAWLVLLGVFSVIYLAQYVLINLSYRQRDAMFPLFLLVAVAGYQESSRHPRWRSIYLAYWMALGVMALTHLALRAAFAG
jgi:hypothetical protein